MLRFLEVYKIDQFLKPLIGTVSFLKLRTRVMGCCLRARIGTRVMTQGDYSGDLYDIRDTNERSPTSRRDSAKSRKPARRFRRYPRPARAARRRAGLCHTLPVA